MIPSYFFLCFVDNAALVGDNLSESLPMCPSLGAASMIVLDKVIKSFDALSPFINAIKVTP